ncbi:unnamed protein product (macronuclear) [Paramecium tetraurelia]|uniref:Thymidylate kinase n=1 Tax=Paramecium tetraurelia TaxID=5888 RepID=A0CKK9_PARTE|nr:uncharacterized protein GSPATT00001040001 [Paramecium tetraurelia]CAK71326.1 unnamed protein product [Paramecium tetraurelia]|eukprot:XP_001438723.1 hypothetical protein (macronuclear) [Paramecium tetraurelia strain d4-2]
MEIIIQQTIKKFNRGVFIALEGLDKSGKSTQAKLLSQKLNAKKVSFPDRTTQLGLIISDYLRGNKNMSDEVIHLLFSANRWEQHTSILKQLQDGTNIVSDRYAYSGVAFSAAKGLPIEWCKAPDAGLIQPDMTFYLTAPIEELSKRGDYGKEIYENSSFQQKVGSFFDQLALEENFYKIDALKSIDEIQAEILNRISEKLNNTSSLQQKKLWKQVL